jgi:cytochrome c556
MRTLLGVSLSVVAMGSTLVYAQNIEPIEKRRAVMKTFANAGTPPFQMLKGAEPFDLAKVQATLKTFQDEGPKLKALFPEDSKSGGNTDAAAKIWQERAAFEQAIDTFVSIAKTAATLINDEVSFKTEYPKVGASCGGCHKEGDGFAPRLGDSLKKLKQ